MGATFAKLFRSSGVASNDDTYNPRISVGALGATNSASQAYACVFQYNNVTDEWTQVDGTCRAKTYSLEGQSDQAVTDTKPLRRNPC